MHLHIWPIPKMENKKIMQFDKMREPADSI